MPVPDFQDGVAPSVSELDAWITEQVISIVTSATRPAGTAGQVIYETDTTKYMGYDGSGWIELGRFTGVNTWTPQVDQGASTNIAKTVSEANYVRRGNLVTAWTLLAMTAAGTGGSIITVTLPVAGANHVSGGIIGSGWIIRTAATAARYSCAVQFNDANLNVVSFLNDLSTSGAVGSVPSYAIASGDQLRFAVTYTVA